MAIFVERCEVDILGEWCKIGNFGAKVITSYFGRKALLGILGGKVLTRHFEGNLLLDIFQESC